MKFTPQRGYDEDGFPLCPKYQEKVLPDEDDLCSLCSLHSASEMYFDHDTQSEKYLNIKQLEITKNNKSIERL